MANELGEDQLCHSKVSDLSVGTNGSVGAMVSAFERAFASDEIQNSLTALVQQIKSIQSLSNFLDTAICTLLTACQNIVLLVLDAIQAVIDAILTAVTAALQVALQVLENEIDIPIISYLYQKIAGSPLTTLDLLCLIIAVPCTILYKIFLGGSGDLTAVWVPDEGSEALRDLVRAREAAKQDQMRARYRLSKFLLRSGQHPPSEVRSWTRPYLIWVVSTEENPRCPMRQAQPDSRQQSETAPDRSLLCGSDPRISD